MSPEQRQPDIIDVFDDDDGPFSTPTVAAPSATDGSRRWLAVVVLMVVGGVMAFGLLDASSPHAPRMASSTTTVVGRNGTPSTVDSQPPLLPTVPLFTADPPVGYQIAVADHQLNVDSGWSDSPYQLWATPGSTLAFGRSFSVELLEGSPTDQVPNAFLVQTSRGPIAVRRDGGGALAADFVVPGTTGMLRITTRGLGVDELERLIDDVHPDLAQPGQWVFDHGAATGFEMVTNVNPELVLAATGEEAIVFVAPETGDVLLVQVSNLAKLPLAASGGQAGEGACCPGASLLLTDPIDLSINGAAAVAGTLDDGQAQRSVVMWDRDGYRVMVTGSLSVPDLIAFATTIFPATQAEWDSMRRAADSVQQVRDVPPTFVDQVVVASGSDGGGWTVTVGMSEGATRETVDWNMTDTGYVTDASPDAHIDTFVDGDRTYILAQLPRSAGIDAQLSVQRSITTTVVPFVDIEQTDDRTFAAYAFTGTDPWSASIVATDGTVLATWDSTPG